MVEIDYSGWLEINDEYLEEKLEKASNDKNLDPNLRELARTILNIKKKRLLRSLSNVVLNDEKGIMLNAISKKKDSLPCPYVEFTFLNNTIQCERMFNDPNHRCYPMDNFKSCWAYKLYRSIYNDRIKSLLDKKGEL